MEGFSRPAHVTANRSMSPQGPGQTHPNKHMPKPPHGPPSLKLLSSPLLPPFQADPITVTQLPPPNPHPLAHLIAAFLNRWDFIDSRRAALDLRCSNRSGPAGSCVMCSPLRSIPNGWEGYLRLNTISGWKVLHYTLTVCFVSCSPFAVF